MVKVCNRCGVELVDANWHLSNKKNQWNICKDCSNEYNRKHTNHERQKEWRDINKNRVNDKHRLYYLKLKILVFNHYCGGEPKCMSPNCAVVGGMKDIRCLSINHINGNGNIHRREIGINGGKGMYDWLIKQGYPEGFNVLCMNCQFVEKSNALEVNVNGYRRTE